ncbi:hypothetical protein RSK20926_14866 [Roseobacter sp. SK209-2-6]|nr:hypothetical protein RSK20926_14866 [Roseobacter sp. SK209-2-6]
MLKPRVQADISGNRLRQTSELLKWRRRADLGAK